MQFPVGAFDSVILHSVQLSKQTLKYSNVWGHAVIRHCERQKKKEKSVVTWDCSISFWWPSSCAREVTVENRTHNIKISFIGSQDFSVC